MKKMFLTIMVGFSLSLSIFAQQSVNIPNSITKNEMSQNGAGSPFRPTLEEMNGGVEYLGKGVYLFTLTEGAFNQIKRDFGKMLVRFRRSHPRLALESMVLAKMDEIGNEKRITAYYVTFREK